MRTRDTRSAPRAGTAAEGRQRKASDSASLVENSVAAITAAARPGPDQIRMVAFHALRNTGESGAELNTDLVPLDD